MYTVRRAPVRYERERALARGQAFLVRVKGTQEAHRAEVVDPDTFRIDGRLVSIGEARDKYEFLSERGTGGTGGTGGSKATVRHASPELKALLAQLAEAAMAGDQASVTRIAAEIAAAKAEEARRQQLLEARLPEIKSLAADITKALVALVYAGHDPTESISRIRAALPPAPAEGTPKG